MTQSLSLALLFICSVSLLGCGNNQNQSAAAEEAVEQEYPLIGKWILTKRMYDPDTTFRTITAKETYHKIITKNSFVWYRYDEDGGRLLGTAGGTYKLEGESYIEDIHFIYPPVRVYSALLSRLSAK